MEMGEYLAEPVNVLGSHRKLTTVAQRPDDRRSDHSNGIKTSLEGFFSNLEFFLSLCLKSIVLRCTEVIEVTCGKVALDKSHLEMMTIFVEILARGMVGQGLSTQSNLEEDKNRTLIIVLTKAKYACDFLIGLTTVLHVEQIRILWKTYLCSFRVSELEEFGDQLHDGESKWTERSLRFVTFSRQLCLYSLERFSVLPSFIPLNFPSKYSGLQRETRTKVEDWLHQFRDHSQSHPLNSSLYEDGRTRLPASGWLADLLINEALSICSLSCKAIVIEATAQILHAQDASVATKSRREHKPASVMKREDLLMFQSYAVHAISVVYELVVRRHAMDKRFQSESCRSRIAAMFVSPILQNSVASVTWLARMEASHKVRSVWLLCSIYVLQEAPEVVIREFTRSCCYQKVCCDA
jgi:hypothetical protein